MGRFLAALVGWLWWWVLPVRKRLAVDNFRRAFPEIDPSVLRATVGEMVLGYLALLLGRRAQLHGVEALEPGSIVLAGHTGAWDLGLISGAERLPVTIFVKPPANPWAARLIEGVRRRVGAELLPPSGSMEAAYAALERGRMVVFVQDQRHNKGIAVDFFGRPALTSPAFAAMAHRTRAPLYGCWQWRDHRGHHLRVERLEWEIPEERDEAITQLTARSQAFYEDCIRRRPHSWLWLHDRWRGGGRATVR